MSKGAYDEAMFRISDQLFRLSCLDDEVTNREDLDTVQEYVAELLKEADEWRAFKEKNKGRWEGVAAAIKRQGMTAVTNDAEVNAISGRRFESDIDEANPETPEEAAERYGYSYGHQFATKRLHRDICDGIEFIKRGAFLEALRWAKQHPEELERWEG